MTKFTTLNGTKKEGKKTEFTHYVYSKMEITETISKPKDWDNVLHIGYDVEYGHVFKAWDDNDKTFALYFGIKGDEFD